MSDSQKFLLPSIMEKTSEEFYRDLEEFYAEHRSHPGPFPRVFGELVDLKSLYLKVESYGGSSRVTYSNKWSEIALSFGVKYNTLNIPTALKDIYQRFLGAYEAHQRMEPLPPTECDASAQARAGKRHLKRYRMIEDLVEVEKQLLSGQENEINFGLNTLLILSSSQKPFRISVNSRLPFVLLELMGACGEDHCHRLITHTKMDYSHFWEQTLKSKGREIRQNLSFPKSPSDQSCLGVFQEFSVAYRVFLLRLSQVLTIFRNLILADSPSLTDRLELGRNLCILRFILSLCHANQENLSSLAMETITGLSMPLESNSPLEQVFYSLIEDSMASADRCHIRCGLQLINNLAQSPINIRHSSNAFACIHNHQSSRNSSIFSKIIASDTIIGSMTRCLCLSDISLLINSLNAMFSVSVRGKAACQQLLRHNLWGHLRYLIFLKAQTLGKASTMGISVYNGSSNFNPVYKFPNHREPRNFDRTDCPDQAFQYFGNLMHAPMPARKHVPVPVIDEETTTTTLEPCIKPKKAINGFPIQGKPNTSYDIEAPRDSPERFARHWVERNFLPDSRFVYDNDQMYSEFLIALKVNANKLSNPPSKEEFSRIIKNIWNTNGNYDEKAQFFQLKCINQEHLSTQNKRKEEAALSPSEIKKPKYSVNTLQNDYTNNKRCILTNGHMSSPDLSQATTSSSSPVLTAMSNQLNSSSQKQQQHLINGNSSHQTNGTLKGHALPLNNSHNPDNIPLGYPNGESNGLPNPPKHVEEKLPRGDANNNSDNLQKPHQEISAFQCKWTNCHMRNHEKAFFSNANLLSSHVYNTHFLSIKDEKTVYCPWQNCPDNSVKRTPISLLSHLSDRHYKPELVRVHEKPKITHLTNGEGPHLIQMNGPSNDNIQEVISRTSVPENGLKKTFLIMDGPDRSNVVTTNHFNRNIGRPDSAKRNYFTNKSGREFRHDNPVPASLDNQQNNSSHANHYEGPVTKHIRHLSLLILRNLVQFCPNFVSSKTMVLEESLCSIISSQIDSIELASECLSLIHSQLPQTTSL